MDTRRLERPRSRECDRDSIFNPWRKIEIIGLAKLKPAKESVLESSTFLSGDFGRRKRYAFLATQPPPACQTGPGIGWNPDHDSENRGASAADQQARGILDHHQWLC